MTSEACSTPAERFSHTAASLGLQKEIVQGTEFHHVLFWRNGGPNQTLHVYLDGDGTPTKDGQPAKDPTPRNTLMLRLLSRDLGPAVYVGRPCYNGLNEAIGCFPRLWTTARYSEQVVSSLEKTIRGIMSQSGYQHLALFGHSGGGTLAILLAARFTETKVVATIAANIDINAWTQFHGLAPLEDSLNPATQEPLPNYIIQIHFGGGRDQIVPPMLIKTPAKRLGGRVEIVEDFDHVCCWERKWPEILNRISTYE